MFGFEKNSFLGVDIGTSSIKVVELKLSGKKPVLSNYGWVILDGLEGERDSLSLWGKHIAQITKEGKFKSKEAYVSVSSSGSLISLIEFPDMDRNDLEQAIKFEAHKYVPVPLDEVVLSWDVVGVVEDTSKKAENQAGEASKKETAGSKKIQVLLVAAPKIKIIKYENLINTAGLKLRSIEIENFSLVRSLIGNDPGNFIIVDIGARVCNIILVEKGIIKVNRNIYSGGVDITRSIGKSMNIEESRAESMKISGENFLSGDSKMIFPSLEVVTAEIKRVLNSYYKNGYEQKVSSLVISGGTAGLNGIVEYFQNSLGLKTVIGNPLGRLDYPKILEPKVNEIKNRFAVAVGLALKGVEEYLKK
jgi:type IV pilus assembly protein PilM